MQNTKKRLLTSSVALLLCFAMLLGTTYAWFTDSVASVDNVVKTGNFNIEMYWSDTYLPVDSDKWQDVSGPIFTYDKWEPGYTDVKYVKISNLGDFALKWKLNIEAQGEMSELAEVIDVYYVNPASETVATLEGRKSVGVLSDVVANHVTTSGVLLPDGETDPKYVTGETVIAIAMHMHKTAGREYMDKSIGEGFTINLIATQFNHETDAFGNSDYDINSEWPDNVIVADNMATAKVTNNNGFVGSPVSLISEDGNISASVPAGVKLEDGANKVTLAVSKVEESNANVTVAENEAALSIDVHVHGVAATNETVMAIGIKALLPANLNIGNYRFYHVENGSTVEMILLGDGAPVHNNFEYDPATGDVVLYLKSFSEVALVANTENAWNGVIASSFAGGDGTAENPYIIANADQLAYLGEVISNNNEEYGDKNYKLIANINLGGEENVNKGIVFYPIGYTKVGGSVATIDIDNAPEHFAFDDEGEDYANSHSVTLGAGSRTAVWYTYGGAFRGVFDGNGNTISNIYQNTWQMKGDYEGANYYWNDAMGIFGYVYNGTVKNLTVDNFSSDGEFTPTGVVAAYAANATFENIALTSCNPRVYNTGNGGIVGVGGSSSDTSDKKLTFTNITVDNSNKISALWGSWDVACGGIMGMFRGNGLVHFENCHIGAQIDVYNDVCGNYQYYWYRYSGMVIGSIRGKNIKDENGYTVPDVTGITANECTVHFGDWNDYYYCELVANSLASYTHDHQFSRLTEISSLDEIKNGEAWTKSGNFLLGGECYHIVNRDGVLTRHFHADAGTEVVNGVTVLKEDKQIVYLPFNQLIQGDGWGVKTIGFRNDSELDFDGIKILDRDEANSIDKFTAIVNGGSFEMGTTVTVGDIFKAVDGVSINANTLKVFVSPVGEDSTASAVFTPNTSDWTKGTITFSGEGAAKIVITDYTYCKEAITSTIIVKHEHRFNSVVTEPTCEVGGYTTYTCDCGYSYVADEVAALGHKAGADATCTTAKTCTVCGMELESKLGHTAGSTVVENNVAPGCENDGHYDNVVYCVVCKDEISRETITVVALGHKEVIDAAVEPTCTATGLTEGKHCSVCDKVFVAQETIDALGHKAGAEATCTTAQTCTVCGAELVAALGHKAGAEATCTTAQICTVCDVELIAALGQIKTKFTGDFLYRVGNQNTVNLSSLFNVGKTNVEAGFVGVSGTASATITTNGVIEFKGTGVIKVILNCDCNCGECDLELTLEVVDAVNATSAMNATSNNVVMLNDAGFGSITVSNGYTLYGNGFTLTCGSDSAALNTGYEFVELNNGTLDNVQIICPNFDYAVLYSSNMTESGNRTEVTDKTRYFNVKSAVESNGNSQILNSYISGGRAAVNVVGGNCLIDNSRLEGGAVATLLVGSANGVILRDITLVQKPTASTYDSNKKLMGFSVLFICDSDGNAAPVIIEGTLVQDAWVNEEYTQYVPSAGRSIISTVLGKTDYLHDIDGDGTKESLNLGFAYMPESLTSNVNATTITDSRTDKGSIPYDYVDVSILTGKTYVYSYKNSNGTADKFKNVVEYKPNKQSDIITVSYSDIADGIENSKSYGTNGWIYELNVDLDKAAGYKFDFSKLVMSVNGNLITDFKVNGATKPSSPITVESGGVTYTLTATVDGKVYTAYYKVTGTETSKDSPSLVGTPGYGAGFGVSNSYGGDWSGAAPVLDGITIRYWSVAESAYKDFNLSDIIFNQVGKQNGTNSYWEYTHTNNDFTLKLTNTVAMHDKSQTFGMPVVGKDGKLYFTIAGTGGFVSSGTTSRSITISYEFRDNNGGEVLKFSHTWSIAYNKDNQYNYNSFVKDGTLTKLEASSGGGCVTPDTLITLADGTQVRVDSLTGNEELLVWNMETGKLDKANIMFVDSDPAAEVEVITLKFSDGTEVKVIYEHGFWDYDLNKYVYLDKDAYDYIGHTFAKQNGDALEKVVLVDVEVSTETTMAWSPVTVGHLCYFVNGMLSMPGGVGGLFNIFEVDAETMTYDFEQIEKDIETYGLYTYEELNAICPLSEDMFNAAGGAYLKISIGKGNLTEEELFNMIERYSKYFG